MSWNSQTLADTLPAVLAAASTAVTAAQRELNAIDAAISRAQDQLLKSNTRFEAVEDLLASLTPELGEQSGIYQLTLSPATGAWNQRILNAQGAPPRNPSDFSAIICNLSLTADFNTAEAVKTTIDDAKNKTFVPPSDRIKVPAIKPPARSPDPQLPEPAVSDENVWQSATLTDLFPGTQKAVLESYVASKSDVDKYSTGLDDLDKERDKIQQKLNEAQQLVNGLNSSGIYNFTALPELTPSADWYSRLIAPNADLPPFDPDLYSSGTVIVLVASTYLELLNNYSKIQTALNTVLV